MVEETNCNINDKRIKHKKQSLYLIIIGIIFLLLTIIVRLELVEVIGFICLVGGIISYLLNMREKKT